MHWAYVLMGTFRGNYRRWAMHCARDECLYLLHFLRNLGFSPAWRRFCPSCVSVPRNATKLNWLPLRRVITAKGVVSLSTERLGLRMCKTLSGLLSSAALSPVPYGTWMHSFASDFYQCTDNIASSVELCSTAPSYMGVRVNFPLQ